MTGEPKMVILGGRRMGQEALEAMLETMRAGEQQALVLLRDDPPAIEGLAELQAHVREAAQPRAPHDRGTGGRVRPKESLTQMMARIARETKPHWQAPAIKEDFLCTNCDGAPDGGHVGDAWCIHSLDEDRDNTPCTKCGRADVPLHVDGQCGHCGPKEEL